MCDGRAPYGDMHPLKEFFYTATRGAPDFEDPTRWSDSFKDLVSHILDPDPSTRWTAGRLLEVRVRGNESGEVDSRYRFQRLRERGCL